MLEESMRWPASWDCGGIAELKIRLDAAGIGCQMMALCGSAIIKLGPNDDDWDYVIQSLVDGVVSVYTHNSNLKTKYAANVKAYGFNNDVIETSASFGSAAEAATFISGLKRSGIKK